MVWGLTGAPLSAPVAKNCIVPKADCKTKGTFVPNKSAYAEGPAGQWG